MDPFQQEFRVHKYMFVDVSMRQSENAVPILQQKGYGNFTHNLNKQIIIILAI
jgi:hypothetical protein